MIWFAAISTFWVLYSLLFKRGSGKVWKHTRTSHCIKKKDRDKISEPKTIYFGSIDILIVVWFFLNREKKMERNMKHGDMVGGKKNISFFNCLDVKTQCHTIKKIFIFPVIFDVWKLLCMYMYISVMCDNQ